MLNGRRLRTAAGVLAVVLMWLGLPLLPSSQLPATAAGAATPTPGPPVTVTLTSITPRSPDPTNYKQVVTIRATITNNTDVNYSDYEVGLERGVPITQQNLLDAAIAKSPDTDNLRPNDVDQKHPLPAHASATVTYRSNPSNEIGGMCLCFTGVFPYALVIHALSDPSVGFEEVGRTQMFVPSFQEKPQPVTVAWLWPLLEPPHRTLSSTVFTDDELAVSVSPGGRLYRALQVPELLRGQVRLTLVVDPDLLDSLAVMASPQGYQYRRGKATVSGTGGAAAQAWLNRLAALRGADDITLTAYGDPDIDAVTRAGLAWSTALDPQVQARIGPTVGSIDNSLMWPAGGVLTDKALDTAVAGGTSAVVLSDAALPGQNKTEPRPNAISPLPTASGQARALVTDSAIERTVGQIFKLGAIPAQAQQTLLAQLAIRAVQDPQSVHFVVIAPDRYVNTDAAVAVDTIRASVTNSWSKSTSIGAALATVTPVDRGALHSAAASPATEVSSTIIDTVSRVQRQVASLRAALNSESAAALLGGYNAALQRAESNAWRVNPAAGRATVNELSTDIERQLNSVSLIQPDNQAFRQTLSSTDSPVVVTVQNKLDRDVSVRVTVTPDVGVIGFQAERLPVLVIAANSVKTISVPTKVDRVGQFKVVAALSTPDGQALGASVRVNLRATALGGITKTITIVAASVLILALLRRLILRIRGKRPAGGRGGGRPAGPAVGATP
ncbi:MAG: hypothetical protein JWN95_3796 [Frankiales bacterium]|nr:hypothetical protein [Frankiales bacterium]